MEGGMYAGVWGRGNIGGRGKGGGGCIRIKMKL